MLPKTSSSTLRHKGRKRLLKTYHHRQTIDFPPSQVSLFLIFTFKISELNWNSLSSPSSRLVRIADGANNNASPTLRLMIRPKRIPRLVLSLAAIETCLWIILYHSGLEKRWTMNIEHRSISRGDIVGSCVEMITRAP